MPSGKQIRAARALADWSGDELARRVGLTRKSIQGIESDAIQPRAATVEKLIKAFNFVGVEFTDDGVRQRSNEFEVYAGAERFNAFTDFVYEHMREFGGDVCVSAVDERLFSKYRKDHELHRARMQELVDGGRVRFRILASESNFVSSYAEHRWLPASANASPASFYAFGNCLALISFEHDPAPYVALHKSGPFAQMFRQAFEAAWESAKRPPKAGVK